VRPLWWEFPEDRFIDVDDRAMLGSALLVVPFLTREPDTLFIEFPEASNWYDYDTLAPIEEPFLKVPWNGGKTAVFLRGGSVLPYQRRIRRASAIMARDPYALIVALDKHGKAKGELYIDDGETFDFMKGGFIAISYAFDGGKFTAVAVGEAKKSEFGKSFSGLVEQIKVVGLKASPTDIVNGKGQSLRFDWENQTIIIHKPDLPLKEDFILTFKD
jgi:alpha 1,3-glucosidase